MNGAETVFMGLLVGLATLLSEGTSLSCLPHLRTKMRGRIEASVDEAEESLVLFPEVGEEFGRRGLREARLPVFDGLD